MATRGVTHFSNDIFGGIAAVEPDQSKSFSSESIEIGEDGAMYVYVPRENMPPSKFQKELDRVQKKFKEAFPDTTVIVGAHDLKFTAITKKQEFKSRLDGTLD